MATPNAALALVAGAEEVMIIGGGKVYEQVLPTADRIYMTRVDAIPDGDTFFPEINNEEWQVVEQEDISAGKSGELGYSFITLDRLA